MKNHVKMTTLLAFAAMIGSVQPSPVEARGYNASSGTHRGEAAADMQRDTGMWENESAYWRDNFSSRPYYNRSTNYTMYEPAYRYGWDLYGRNHGKAFSDLNEKEMRMGWNDARGNSSLTWEQAQRATRDAYNRRYQGNMTSGSGTVSSEGTPKKF